MGTFRKLKEIFEELKPKSCPHYLKNSVVTTTPSPVKLYDDQLRFFLDNLWRWKHGIPELKEDGYHAYGKAKDLKDIPSGQYQEDFTKGMNHRMVMGYFRYGDKSNPMQRKTFDYIKSIERRLAMYKEEGNLEQLLDIANICRMEFEHPQHPKAHLKLTDDKNHTPPETKYE